TGAQGETAAKDDGFFAIPLLPPGLCRLRAEAPGYQTQQIDNLELAVAARLEVNFALRPLTDLWDLGQSRQIALPESEVVVTMFGPDVGMGRTATVSAARRVRGTLEAAVSQVVDPRALRDLPFARRDLYAMLALQAGVTSDTSTARGLGLSVLGTRPTASQFLLDGVENNNPVTTGPLTAVAPEAMQEYRISTSNFSAEYGRSAGFIANAVTRAGTPSWHGLAYWNLRNDAFDANTFERNLLGLPCAPLNENQAGAQAGGPIVKGRWFSSSSFERLRSRTFADPLEVTLPSTNFLAFTAPGSLARQLLETYPAPPVDNGILPLARTQLSPPAFTNRWLGLQRIDYAPTASRHRVSGRFLISMQDRPGFFWSPYPDFNAPLDQSGWNASANLQSSWRGGLATEFRAAYSRDIIAWDRPLPEIPTLLEGASGTLLPGSLLLYDYDNRGRTFEFSGGLLRARGRHVTKAGGGFLLRRVDGELAAGRDGQYLFRDILDFTLDRPSQLFVALDRTQLESPALPRYPRTYTQRQFHLYAQDTWRLSSRLTLNGGLRYESLGAPRNTGPVEDLLVTVNPLQITPGRALYAPDRHNWAVRAGASWSLDAAATRLLRFGYGVFYDRPFENVWQSVRNNSWTLANYVLSGRVNYLAPISEVIASQPDPPLAAGFPSFTAIDPQLRSGLAHRLFLGFQQRVNDQWFLELNGLGTLGRRLLSTDILNRRGELGYREEVAFRSSQGSSDFWGFTAAVRYRGRRGQLHAAWTWSHAIDVQSDPLAGDFFDLAFTRTGGTNEFRPRAAFTREGDPASDRGSADFDQRHNFVLSGIAPLPWRFQLAGLAALRGGFPFSVFASGPQDPLAPVLLNNRADLLNPSTALIDQPAPGGRRLLNAAAFAAPAANLLGNTGRNAFTGPGLASLDLSLSRQFSLGENLRLTLRADAFNILNHANLNPPESALAAANSSFGLATYGRRGRSSGFPAEIPFNETARTIQFLLRLEF
nr:TonB-dependent receptor [Bryobacter sp.]